MLRPSGGHPELAHLSHSDLTKTEGSVHGVENMPTTHLFASSITVHIVGVSEVDEGPKVNRGL